MLITSFRNGNMIKNISGPKQDSMFRNNSKSFRRTNQKANNIMPIGFGFGENTKKFVNKDFEIESKKRSNLYLQDLQRRQEDTNNIFGDFSKIPSVPSILAGTPRVMTRQLSSSLLQLQDNAQNTNQAQIDPLAMGSNSKRASSKKVEPKPKKAPKKEENKETRWKKEDDRK